MANADPLSSAQKIEFFYPNTRETFTLPLSNRKSFVIGSGKSDDLVIAREGIVRQHVELFAEKGNIEIRPRPGNAVSVNGQAVAAGMPLKNGDWLVLGSTLLHVRLLGGPVQQPEPKTSNKPARPNGDSQTIVIGRSPECDVIIDSPVVSGRHTSLSPEPEGWVLRDLGSTNGTFINGERLVGPILLREGDRIAIAAFTYLFTGDALQPIDDTGRIRIEVRNLGKTVKNKSGEKRILEDISLVIEPGEFVAIFGTSGSGKSTLMDALNGRRQANEGGVFYNGADLYQSFGRFRSSIGYVPQQDIVHRKILVRNALRYTARLRLPPDLSDAELVRYIEKVLAQVELAEKADLPVDTPIPLSGGQLKRVSLAVELVANPNVLFLDEVTSGLDAGTDKKMMRLFAGLAATGKTVVCVTHTLESIDNCSLVILLHQGRLVYYGPPNEAPAYFGIDKLSDVYELLEASSAGEWANRFIQSPSYRHFVEGRLSATESLVQPAAATSAAPNKGPREWFSWRQTQTLMRRYGDLILSDSRNLAIMLLQAPLIGLVIGSVFTISGSPLEKALAQGQIAFILILSAIWFGCLNSARELVKELPIYLRERSVNLAIGPYLFSKLVPLSALCLIQCLVLLAIVRLMQPLSGTFIAQAAVLFLAGMAATTMGLTISAFVDTNDKAVAIVPILLIPQAVLSNAVTTLEGTGEWLGKLTMISYWAYDAMKASFSDEILGLKDFQGKAVMPLSGNFGADLAIIATFFFVFLASAVIGLKLKDRKK
ncbi:MAG: FHA domain-containing protein [Gammaproteobacteria bacterium]